MLILSYTCYNAFKLIPFSWKHGSVYLARTEWTLFDEQANCAISRIHDRTGIDFLTYFMQEVCVLC